MLLTSVLCGKSNSLMYTIVCVCVCVCVLDGAESCGDVAQLL